VLAVEVWTSSSLASQQLLAVLPVQGFCQHLLLHHTKSVLWLQPNRTVQIGARAAASGLESCGELAYNY